MNGSDVHDWNVMIVEKRGFPRPASKEFQVKSATLLGAAMKARKIIKNNHKDCVVQSVWWLDPNRTRRDLR